MAKESFYFSHDYTARNDDKILELRSKFGAEGYGIFWMIIETMAQNDNGGVKAGLMGGLSLGFGVDKKRLEEVFFYCVEIELFYKENDYIFSKRLLSHKDFRKKLSESGQKGAETRKKMGGYKGGYSPPYGKERKGKEIINNTLVKNSANGNSKFSGNFKAQGEELAAARIARNLEAKAIADREKNIEQQA